MENRYDKFTSLILSIYRSIQKIKNMEMSDFGLKGNQVQCMFHLYENEKGKTLNELCALCFEDKGALSRSIKDLEDKGLVIQIESEKKYRNPYVLTEIGRELGSKIVDLTIEMVNKGSDGIKFEKREEFYKNLSVVNKNLQTVCNTYGKK